LKSVLQLQALWCQLSSARIIEKRKKVSVSHACFVNHWVSLQD
jgi:hypothetical protein